MAALDAILDPREDYLNAEFVDETTLWEALKIMFAPGYSEPAIKEGKLIPIRTVAGTDYSHLYTPDSMLDGVTIDDRHYDGQENDGIDVEYLDEDSGEMEVVECRMPSDSGRRVRVVQSIGITNRTRAWRYGMRLRREEYYKPSNFTFTTEMDGLNSEYGDPVALASEIWGGQTGAVIAESGNTITLDFTPELSAASPFPQYFAAFKKPNGRFSGLYSISFGSPLNFITITDSPGIDFAPTVTANPGDNTLVAIGTSDQWAKRAIIRRITPQSEDQVQVLCSEYVAEVLADDDNSPP